MSEERAGTIDLAILLLFLVLVNTIGKIVVVACSAINKNLVRRSDSDGKNVFPTDNRTRNQLRNTREGRC